jgi:hypothetical protein
MVSVSLLIVYIFFFFFLYPFCPIPRLPLLLRITIYSRQVALEASYLGQLDSQYLYLLGSLGGPAIPPGTGCLNQLNHSHVSEIWNLDIIKHNHLQMKATYINKYAKYLL